MTAAKGSLAANPPPATGQLWADKYRPATISQMCYPSCANKLKAWLEHFDATVNSGASRGVLLSGPPGVGKTTTVYVVARELGRTVIEYNASDFRSRKSLHENVSTLTHNRAFSTGAASYTHAVLLMDEVDGCDLGGVGEVIEMIRTTQIPIVCTCNDRWNPKLRSLMNVVVDLRFTRPPCDIVANYLCDRVLAREGISLSKPLLKDIIKRSGSDIRNMLNSLQLWCLGRYKLDQRQLAECAVQSEKNGEEGLFQAAEFFLLQGTSRGERHTLREMETTYFNADMVDMFVQENYLHFSPPDEDWMTAVERGAACISRADHAQRMMYLEQNWSASRTYVLLSSIAPCVYTRGRYVSFLEGTQVFFDRQRPVKFPSWLGHNSTAAKNRRLCRCVAMQAQKVVSGHSEDLALDYIPLGFEWPLLQPLAEKEKDGIADVIRFMDQYGLLRDDWDFVQDMAHFRRMRPAQHTTRSTADLALAIATAVKSAFTREFNRTHRINSFAKTALTNKRGDAGAVDDGAGDNPSEDDSPAPTQTPAPGKRGKAAAPKKKKAEPPAAGSEKTAKKAPFAKASKAKRKRARKESSEDSFVVRDGGGSEID